ncbi:hypothetical protein VaNZ11_006703 [Volvox africanus]|uniref:WW domain-containing protein n=1 Tax=Volvox africanus TaxID=51714 RepID=A0ABQ5S309_9CHLO|nr:hypothetical protein VaNZ11_006703 [Volvox africanus]
MLLCCKEACSCRLRLRKGIIRSDTWPSHALNYADSCWVAKSAAYGAPLHRKPQVATATPTAARAQQPPSLPPVFLPLLTALRKINNDPKQLVGWEVRLVPKAESDAAKAVGNRRPRRSKSLLITQCFRNSANPDDILGSSLGRVVEVLMMSADTSADAAEKTGVSVNPQQGLDEEKPLPPPPPPSLPSGRRSPTGGISGIGAACHPGTEPAATTTATIATSAAPDVDQLRPQTIMLRAVQHTVVQEYDFTGHEEYVIRLDPEVVPHADMSSRTLFVEPSEGLLQQGRKSLLLQLLRREISNLPGLVPAPLQHHLSTKPTASTRKETPMNQSPSSRPVAEMVDSQAGSAAPGHEQGHNLGRMPGRKQLLDVGREDLVALVLEAGGFSEVAVNLGLRCTRRRHGYWSGPDSWDRLREELAAFVACGWVELPHPDNPGRTYFYNQISHRTTWRRPPPLRRLPAAPGSLGPDGTSNRSGNGERWMLTEAAADQVMPSRSLVLQARRLDLHYAIEFHGGYLHVAARLGRRVTWAPSKHVYDSQAAIRRGLTAAAKELQLPPGVLPTSRELRLSGYGTLLNAVRRHEALRDLMGIRRRLGSRSQRPRDRWEDLGALAEELSRIAGTVSATTSPPLLMPRLSQLRAGGRHDLVYALSVRHVGRERELAELAGLQLAPDGRGRNRNALGLDAVVEAIQATCQTPKEIREYLRQHRQTDISRQHLTSYLARMASEGRLVKMSYGRYGLPAAVPACRDEDKEDRG